MQAAGRRHNLSSLALNEGRIVSDTERAHLAATTSVARHHIVWGAIGLAAGLAVALPTVYWSSDAAKPPVQRAAPPITIKSTVVAPVLISGPKAVNREEAVRTQAVGPAAPAVADDRQELLREAEALIAERAIGAARTKLMALADGGHAEALYLLAGTYDPIHLAVLGVTDVKAEAERARHLYQRALEGGVDKARQRLEQLQ